MTEVARRLKFQLRKAIIGVVVIWLLTPSVIFLFYGTLPENPGILGDTLGTVNALFSALAFALLIYSSAMQRTELELQRTELEQTRKEFLTNRVTNIIYNQLERFEGAVKGFKIFSGGAEFVGYEAFFFLQREKDALEIPGDNDIESRKHWNIITLRPYSQNSISITQFTLQAYSSSTVVRDTLLGSKLSLEEMQELKNLYFRNIGFVLINVLQDIVDRYSEYLNICKVDGNYTSENEIDLLNLGQSCILLNTVLKFRKTVFTPENIEEIKNKWKEESGKYA